jgi:hypothetical protein
MFHLPGSLRLVTISLLAALMPIGTACAEHFKFIVVFTEGSLTGNAYAGYYSTDKPSGYFFPDAHGGDQLMSLEIVIDGAKFMMQDDIAFPYLPRIKVQSGQTTIFDFDAGDGSATSPNKWMWMYLNNGGATNHIQFGSWSHGEHIVESSGVIFDIYPIDPRRAPPAPECMDCHSRLRR